MKLFRAERMRSLIREHVGQLIIKEIEVDGAVITVTDVEISKKLDYALIRVSVLPQEKKEEVLRILGKRARSFHHKLIRELPIKPIPRIVFELDQGAENAANVEKALLDNERAPTK